MTTHLISYTHSGLPRIDEVSSCFSPLKIYVPWGGSLPEYADNSEIITSYPPEEFKPEADFNLLLDECFNWAYEQGEKSRKEIIKTGHTNPTSNESLRHIKTILSNRITDTSEKDTILRWHMLLHLADRFEENRYEANRMLENLKKKPSPLLHNADLTENTQYPLENLRGIGTDFFINDTNIKQLLKAWYGLFNSLIDKEDMLLTIESHIFDHISEQWNIFNNNNDPKKPDIIFFKSPLLKRTDVKSTDVTIGNDIQDIVISKIKQEDKITDLKKLTSEFEALHKSETENTQIAFSILLFQPTEKSEEVINDPIINFLSGKALIYAEINACLPES